MENGTNGLYADVPLRAPDINLPASWLDLPRQRMGLIVPKAPVVVEQLDIRGHGMEPYIVYPDGRYCLVDEPDEWEVPLPSGTRWFAAVRLGRAKNWREMNDSPTQLLAEFVNIRNGDVCEVTAFAQKWGPIWLCHKHRPCLYMPTSAWFESCLTSECSWYPAEPVSVFRDLSLRAYSLWRIAEQLTAGNSGTAEDWSALGKRPEISSMEIGWQRAYVARTLNAWLSMSVGTSLIIDWFPDPMQWNEPGLLPKMAVRPGLGFFPLACLQLAQHISGALELVFCECGRGYTQKRKRSNKVQPNYCPACRGRIRGNRYYHSHRAVCIKCGQTKQISEVMAREYGSICNACMKPRKKVECEECGDVFPITVGRRKRYGNICRKCLGFTGEYDVETGSYADDPKAPH